MNVVSYIRVSTDGQCGDDKFGLEVQRDAIQEYCSKNGMTIIAEYRDEGESGAKERPGFDSIIYGSVFNPPVEAVVVAKSDRVARDINIYYYYKMMLAKKDIKLISVSEDFGAMGAFASMLEAFTLCVAEMERQNITKRTTGGRKIKANSGGYSGGNAPTGYKVQNGELVINDDEARAVRRIFELHDKGVTMVDIAATVTEEGYRTRNGKPFRQSTISRIIANRKTYEGFYKYGNDEWVKGKHKPII